MSTQQILQNQWEIERLLKNQQASMDSFSKNMVEAVVGLANAQKNNNLDGYSECETFIISDDQGQSEFAAYTPLTLPTGPLTFRPLVTGDAYNGFFYYEAPTAYDYCVFTKIVYSINATYMSTGFLPVYFGSTTNDKLSKLSLDMEAYEAGGVWDLVSENNAVGTDNDITVTLSQDRKRTHIFKNIVRGKVKRFALPTYTVNNSYLWLTVASERNCCIFQGYRR